MRRSNSSWIVVVGLGISGCKIENVRPGAEQAPADASSTETIDALTRRIEALEAAGRAQDQTVLELQAALEDLRAELRTEAQAKTAVAEPAPPAPTDTGSAVEETPTPGDRPRPTAPAEDRAKPDKPADAARPAAPSPASPGGA